MKKETRKYYHASARRYHAGELIEGRSVEARRGGLWIFLADSPVPHGTIADKALEEGWYVYEVAPQDKVRHTHGEDDLVAKRVVVLRRVGSARGILQRWKARHENLAGSAVKSRYVDVTRASLCNEVSEIERLRKTLTRREFGSRVRQLRALTERCPLCLELLTDRRGGKRKSMKSCWSCHARQDSRGCCRRCDAVGVWKDTQVGACRECGREWRLDSEAK